VEDVKVFPGPFVSRHYTIDYTAQLSWSESYELLNKIHFGDWKLHDNERDYSDWDSMKLSNEGYWDMMDIYLPLGKWK